MKKLTVAEEKLLNGLFGQLYSTVKFFILLNAPEIGERNARVMARITTEKLAELFAETPISLTKEASDE